MNPIKKYFLPLLICCSYSTAEAQQYVKEKKYIREQYAAVNKQLNSYRKDSVDLWGSTEGGYGVRYIKDTAPALLVAVYYGEMYRQRDEYYYDKGQLIFHIQFMYKYNRPMYYTKKSAQENNDREWFDEKKTKRWAKRFYFYNNALFLISDEAGKNKIFSKEEMDTAQKEVLENELKLKQTFWNQEKADKQ
jgi:hypothetical protein